MISNFYSSISISTFQFHSSSIMVVANDWELPGNWPVVVRKNWEECSNFSEIFCKSSQDYPPFWLLSIASKRNCDFLVADHCQTMELEDCDLLEIILKFAPRQFESMVTQHHCNARGGCIDLLWILILISFYRIPFLCIAGWAGIIETFLFARGALPTRGAAGML